MDKGAITAEYRRLMGREPVRWEMDRFRADRCAGADVAARILQSEEYEDELRAALARCYACLVGEVLPSDHPLDALRAALGERGIRPEEIREYVVLMPEYRRRHEAIIQQFLHLHNKIVPNSVIDTLVARFANIEHYNTDNLLEDIRGDNFATASLVPGPPGPRPPGPQPHSGLASMLQYIAKWRVANHRAPDACELARFYAEQPCASVEEMRELSSLVDAAFAAAANYHRTYLEEELSKTDFLCDWIDRFDAPDFEEDVLNAVITGEEYVAKMRARLAAIHRDTFISDIHPDDAEFCFAVARCERLPLNSERLSNIVIDMTTALGDIEARVDAAYLAVLERRADAEEKRDNVARFRYAEGAAAEESSLRFELYESLEFQEVVKGLINKKYTEARGAAIKPKQLYETLAALLAKYRGRMAEHVIPNFEAAM